MSNGFYHLIQWLGGTASLGVVSYKPRPSRIVGFIPSINVILILSVEYWSDNRKCRKQREKN